MSRLILKRGLRGAGWLAIAGTLGNQYAAAIDVPAFFLEFPTVYVMGAVVTSPPPDTFTFVTGPVAFYSPPYTATIGVGSVSAVGSSTHIIAPHAGEVAPGPTWNFDLAVAVPTPYGMAENRKRKTIMHSDEHGDRYMAVLGAFSGTVPGPSKASIKGFIGGSVGRHDKPNGGGQLLMKATRLTPPSGQMDFTTEDFPVGQVLLIGDVGTSQLTALVVAAGIQDGDVQGVNLLSGPTGPVLFSLRPMMTQEPAGPYAAAFAMGDVPIPVSVMQKIATGNVWVGVETHTSIDFQITGLLEEVGCDGDLDGDGFVGLSDLSIALSNYGLLHGATAEQGDLDGDGDVDLGDLATELGLYGTTCH